MDNSVLMDFSKLTYAEFDFEIISVIKQYWDDIRGWTEFMYTPRNSSALLMVVSDTTVRYTDNSGDTFGKTGDGSMSFLNRPLSYRTVPCPICYNEMLFVTFKLPKFALTRIFVYRIILSIINAVT